MPEELAGEDTSLNTESAPADTSVDQGTPAVDTAPDGSAPADTQTDVQADSLTPPIPVRAPNQAQPPAQVNAPDPIQEMERMRARYDEVRAHANRVANENQTFRKQWDGLDPNRVREVMAEHEKREKASKLNPWNAGHPEHPKFQQLQQKAQTFRNALANASTEEEKAVIKRVLGSQFTPDDLQTIQSAEADRLQRMEQFHADPAGFVTQMVEPIIQQKLAEFDQFMGARTNAMTMLSDPGNQALIQKYAPEMADIMDGKIPARELAFEHAKLKAENEALKRRVGEQIETESTAEAQLAARRGPGRPPGSPNKPRSTAPARDPLAILAERKIFFGDPRYASELAKLNNQQRA